jgi:tetratricopeptide (TPR) repeat protein
MRAFIRYKLLETDNLNNAGNSNGFTPKHTSALPDIDYRLVKNDLDRVIEIYPGSAVAYYNRANVSAKLNDFKSAIVDYTKAIEIDSRFAAAYYNRGLAKIYLGNNEGGVADLSKAGELGMYQAYNVIKRFKNAVRR